MTYQEKLDTAYAYFLSTYTVLVGSIQSLLGLLYDSYEPNQKLVFKAGYDLGVSDEQAEQPDVPINNGPEEYSGMTEELQNAEKIFLRYIKGDDQPKWAYGYVSPIWNHIHCFITDNGIFTEDRVTHFMIPPATE